MAGALGLSLAGPRHYGGVLVDDAEMGAGGRREANAADIRRALALYRAADLILVVLIGLIAAAVIAAWAMMRSRSTCFSRCAARAVERRVDAGLVVEAAARGAEPRQPSGALAVVGEQAVDVGAGYPAVGRGAPSGVVSASCANGRARSGPSVAPICIS